jgi:hypothetical protein
MASKNKTTILTRTQDTITQQELVELRILQVRIDRLVAACQCRQGLIAEKCRANAVVQPGRFFLAGTSVEERA